MQLKHLIYTGIDHKQYFAKTLNDSLIWIDLSGCESPFVILRLPDTVETVVFNETVTIPMLQVLRKSVKQIEFKGTIPDHVIKHLNLDDRVIRICNQTSEQTILNLAHIPGINHTAYLLSAPGARIPVSLISKIPPNIQKVIISYHISEEELDALGCNITKVQIISPIQTESDLYVRAAMVNALPQNIAVYGSSGVCIRPLKTLTEVPLFTFALGHKASSPDEEIEMLKKRLKESNCKRKRPVNSYFSSNHNTKKRQNTHSPAQQEKLEVADALLSLSKVK